MYGLILVYHAIFFIQLTNDGIDIGGTLQIEQGPGIARRNGESIHSIFYRRRQMTGAGQGVLRPAGKSGKNGLNAKQQKQSAR